MKQKYIDLYMDWAFRAAELSHARRLKVGAVIVKDDSVISYGYNGQPHGWDNDCETVEWCTAGGWLDPDEIAQEWPYQGQRTNADGYTVSDRYRLVTKPTVLHAERNALDKMAKKGSPGGAGAVMFATHAPCLECAKSIYGSGIVQLCYAHDYRTPAGTDFLTKCKVEVKKIDVRSQV
jgi:dCMP deaminase